MGIRISLVNSRKAKLCPSQFIDLLAFSSFFYQFVVVYIQTKVNFQDKKSKKCFFDLEYGHWNSLIVNDCHSVFLISTSDVSKHVLSFVNFKEKKVEKSSPKVDFSGKRPPKFGGVSYKICSAVNFFPAWKSFHKKSCFWDFNPQRRTFFRC